MNVGKITRGWLSPLVFAFWTKTSFLAEMGGTPAWEKQLLSSQNALWGCCVNQLSLNHNWHPQDCQIRMETSGKWECRDNDVQGSLGAPVSLDMWAGFRATSRHGIASLFWGEFLFLLMMAFFFKVMICGLPKALSAPWATSVSNNEWQFFLEIFNYGDTQEKSNY